MSSPSPAARSPLKPHSENAAVSPSPAHAAPASTFDLGPAKPARLRAVATHHPVRKLAPTSGVEAILGGAFNAPFNDGRQARAWNENRARQHAGANIFGAQSPVKANQHEQRALDPVKRRQLAVAPTTTAPRNLTLQELRQACRARGVNPGGSRDALIERLDDAIASGACEPIPANASEAYKTTGAGARYASRANEVRAPSASGHATMRESQKIWNNQIRGNDIFGTSFVDAPAAKKRVVEGPNDTLTLGDDDDDDDDVVEDAPKVVLKSIDDVEDAKNVDDEDAANVVAGKRKRGGDVIAPQVEEAVVAPPKQPSAEHRAKAWKSFQGAGLFSEQWTVREEGEDEEDGDAAAEQALVKSSTTSTGAWKSLEEEEAEQAQDDAEVEAEREADAAIAAAERELAEELARESNSD